MPEKDVGRIVALAKQSDAVSSAAELFSDLALSMLEGSSRPDVIVTALPSNLIEKVVNAKSVTEDDEEDDVELNFRDLFKSKALLLSAPTQIVWPTLWDDKAKIPRKLKETLRQVQDPATRAWNLMNAIFYKAGKVPWRLPRAESDFKASYLGIGFYKDLSGQRLLTSTAQMFDERGRGLILRGARARTDKGERHPYLERNDAYDLVLRSIKAYRGHHGHAPARLVILKTSRFEEGEVNGETTRRCEEASSRSERTASSSPEGACRTTGRIPVCACRSRCCCGHIRATPPCWSSRLRSWPLRR